MLFPHHPIYLILPLALPLFLLPQIHAHPPPPPLLPRATPISYPSQNQPVPSIDRTLPLPDLLTLPTLNTTLETTPRCLEDTRTFSPPFRTDCDAVIEGILLAPGALLRRRWHATGTAPLGQWVVDSCRAFLFAKDPNKSVEDSFQGVSIAVVGAGILKVCVGESGEGLGGEGTVGEKGAFVLVITGKPR